MGDQQRVCRICEQGFHPRRADQAYCSTRCRKAARRGAWPTARRQALDRDGHQCQECPATQTLEVHHKQPVAQLGLAAHQLDNLVQPGRNSPPVMLAGSRPKPGSF